MNLDEAIIHATEKGVGCSECQNEHRQLSEWLIELRELRVARQESIDVLNIRRKTILEKIAMMDIVLKHCYLQSAVVLSNRLRDRHIEELDSINRALTKLRMLKK